MDREYMYMNGAWNQEYSIWKPQPAPLHQYCTQPQQPLPQQYFPHPPQPQQLPQCFCQQQLSNQPSPQQLPQQLPQYFPPPQQPSPQECFQYFSQPQLQQHQLPGYEPQQTSLPYVQQPSPQECFQYFSQPQLQQQQLPRYEPLQTSLPYVQQPSPQEYFQYFSQPELQQQQLPRYEPQQTSLPYVQQPSLQQFSQPQLPLYQQPPESPQQQQQKQTQTFRTLRAGNLLCWMDEGYISKCFAHIGELVAVKISGDCAFLEFASHIAAERVLQTYNGTFMPGVDLKFNLCLAAGEKGPADDSNSAGDALKLNYKPRAIERFNLHMDMKRRFRKSYMLSRNVRVSMKCKDSFPCDRRGRIELYLGILAAVVGKENALQSLISIGDSPHRYWIGFICYVTGKAALKMRKNMDCFGIYDVSVPLAPIMFSLDDYGDEFVDKSDFDEYVQQLPEQPDIELEEVDEKYFYKSTFWEMKPEDYPLLDDSEPEPDVSEPCLPLDFVSEPYLLGPGRYSSAIFIKEQLDYMCDRDSGVYFHVPDSMPAADPKFSLSWPSDGSGEKCPHDSSKSEGHTPDLSNQHDSSKSEGHTPDLSNQHDPALQHIEFIRRRFELQMQMKLCFREKYMLYDHYSVFMAPKNPFPDRRRMIESFFRVLAAVVGKGRALVSLINTFGTGYRIMIYCKSVGSFRQSVGFVCRIPGKAALKMKKNKACLGIEDMCVFSLGGGNKRDEFVDKSEFASYVQQLPKHPDMVLEEVGEEDFYQSFFAEVKPEDYPPLDKSEPYDLELQLGEEDSLSLNESGLEDNDSELEDSELEEYNNDEPVPLYVQPHVSEYCLGPPLDTSAILLTPVY